MLILSRKLHEQIVIGNGIRITVVAIRGKQVRVGIQAPADVHIRRDELEPLDHNTNTAPPPTPTAATPVTVTSEQR